jgi:hypothetical protein
LEQEGIPTAQIHHFRYPERSHDGARQRPRICPHALELFSSSSSSSSSPSSTVLVDLYAQLEEQIEMARDFHQRGGNLKSIQLYLDSYIQKTLDRLGMEFIPNEEKDHNSSLGRMPEKEVESDPTETKKRRLTRTIHNNGIDTSVSHQPNATTKEDEGLPRGRRLAKTTTATTTSTTPKQKAVEYLQHFYKTHTVTQGGYNQPLPGYFEGKNWKFLGDQQVLGGRSPGRRVVNVVEPFKEERFRVAMGPMLTMTGPQNCTLMQLDEKYLCQGWDQPSSRMNTTTTYKNRVGARDPLRDRGVQECHIFSIGSNDEWGFEKEVIKHSPHCETHTFDCTMEPLKKPRRKNIHFYKLCLLGDDDDPKKLKQPASSPTTTTSSLPKLPSPPSLFGSYFELWNATGIPHAPRILKLDIEGFEYDVLVSILRTTPSHTWPEQIIMEVHWASRMVDLSWMLRARQAAEMSLFFAVMFNVGGYMPVFREFFPVGCPSCMEVLMVRVICNMDE